MHRLDGTLLPAIGIYGRQPQKCLCSNCAGQQDSVICGPALNRTRSQLHTPNQSIYVTGHISKTPSRWSKKSSKIQGIQASISPSFHHKPVVSKTGQNSNPQPTPLKPTLKRQDVLPLHSSFESGNLPNPKDKWRMGSPPPRG